MIVVKDKIINSAIYVITAKYTNEYIRHILSLQLPTSCPWRTTAGDKARCFKAYSHCCNCKLTSAMSSTACEATEGVASVHVRAMRREDAAVVHEMIHVGAEC